MIKQAYFRGLMQVAADLIQQQRQKQMTWKQKMMASKQKDKQLLRGASAGTADYLQGHGFYKGMPIIERFIERGNDSRWRPRDYRQYQADDSAEKFAPIWQDPAHPVLQDYYENIGRQNRDFYLKHGHRPPADYKYKTQFPYPTHPKKKQMMNQNQWQVNNNRGQQYKGHA